MFYVYKRYVQNEQYVNCVLCKMDTRWSMYSTGVCTSYVRCTCYLVPSKWLVMGHRFGNQADISLLINICVGSNSICCFNNLHKQWISMKNMVLWIKHMIGGLGPPKHMKMQLILIHIYYYTLLVSRRPTISSTCIRLYLYSSVTHRSSLMHPYASIGHQHEIFKTHVRRRQRQK